MNCSILAAYGLVDKQKQYGIDCSFFDVYRRDYESNIRTDTESLLTAQNQNIVGYSVCKEACDVFYSKLSTYTCPLVVTVVPNNLRGAYNSAHTIVYNRTTVGVDDIDTFTVTMNIELEWDNPIVTPDMVINSTTVSLRGVNANVIYPFTVLPYASTYTGLVGTKRIYVLSFSLTDIDNVWLSDDNYRLTYSVAATDGTNTTGFSFQTRFLLTAGVLTGLQNP